MAGAVTTGTTAATPAAGARLLDRRAVRSFLVGPVLVVSVLCSSMSSSGSAQTDPGGGPSTTATTSAPTTTDPVVSSVPATTSTTSAPTTTTTIGPGSTSTTSTTTSRPGPGEPPEPLPPASIELLPPEDSLPPLVLQAPPTPPPGAEDAGRRRALLELRAAQVGLKKAKAAEAALRRKLEPLARRRNEARAALEAIDGEDRRLAIELTGARARLKRVAVAGYIHGGDTQPVDYLLRAADLNDLERRRAIIRAATEARNSAVVEFASAERQASDRVRVAVAELENAEAALLPIDVETNSAAAISLFLAADVEDKRLLLDHETAAAPVGGTDIPRLFLDAYRRAAGKLSKRSPQCRVEWTVVAAIGKVESNHGRYRGAQFALNGDVYPRILGIPLDGTRSSLILDTDQGRFDEDLVFDRAVGPMQFIPSTWLRINEDGNGDGLGDPNNAYDAALGTAAYLCRAVPSGGLDTEEGVRPAIFAYNHSEAYVNKVLEFARLYGYAPPPPLTAPVAPAPPAAP